MAWDCARSYAYVDGAYVREELSKQSINSEFDPWKPTRLVEQEPAALTAVTTMRLFYYDAVDDVAPEDARASQQDYLRRIELLPDTKVRTGWIKSNRRGRHQKAVDVQLAVDALEAAHSGSVDVIALVAGDGDFAPLADAVRRAGPYIFVVAFGNSLSPELAEAADRVIFLPGAPRDWLLQRPH